MTHATLTRRRVSQNRDTRDLYSETSVVGSEVPTEEEGVATGGVALKKQEVATSGVALPELSKDSITRL